MKVLASMPLWALIVILDIICIDILYIGRYFFEGIAYDVAWSSKIGDRALIGVIVIAVLIIKEVPAIGGFFTKPSFQIVCLVTSIAVGLAWQWIDSSNRHIMVTDAYHNMIVAPLMIFSMAMALPIIFTNGSDVKKLASIVLIIIWAFLVGLDVKYDRMDQQRWLKERGHNSQSW